MPINKKITLTLRSLLIGVGAFLASLIFFLMIPHFFISLFSISVDIGHAWLYAAFVGIFFAAASWYADHDDESLGSD